MKLSQLNDKVCTKCFPFISYFKSKNVTAIKILLNIRSISEIRKSLLWLVLTMWSTS